MNDVIDTKPFRELTDEEIIRRYKTENRYYSTIQEHSPLVADLLERLERAHEKA